MKLRNKKTGQEGNFIINKDHFECVDLDYVPLYFSLSELLDEWEDYKPTEPLIKDEKIRKAVRAWAEACSFARIYFDEYHNAFRNINDVGFTTISFLRDVDEDILLLEDSKTYTIAELCGEDEE